MAKRALTVETACPHCGHSPIAAEDVRCPKCNRVFAVGGGFLRHNDREVAPVDAEFGTRIGGLDLLTSDAEAHPGTIAAAMAVLGAYGMSAGLGVVPLGGEANGYLVLGAANLALAITLLSMPAFARPLVIVSSPLQVATWLYLGRSVLGNFETITVALLPLLVLAGVTGATGPRRRSLVLAAVLGFTAFATTERIFARAQPGPQVSAPAIGLRLALPSGYTVLQSTGELGLYLPITGLDPRMRSVAFADPVRNVGGFWSLVEPGRVTPAALAEAMAHLLDGENGEAKLVPTDLHNVPGIGQVAWQVPLTGGRAATATAVKLPDDRTALLVVSAPAASLDGARQSLGAAASFTAQPADHR